MRCIARGRRQGELQTCTRRGRRLNTWARIQTVRANRDVIDANRKRATMGNISLSGKGGGHRRRAAFIGGIPLPGGPRTKKEMPRAIRSRTLCHLRSRWTPTHWTQRRVGMSIQTNKAVLVEEVPTLRRPRDPMVLERLKAHRAAD